MPDVAVARRDKTQSDSQAQGARLVSGGVQYRTWTLHDRVEALVRNAAGQTIREIELAPKGEGYFSGFDVAGRTGDLYRYRLNDGDDWPDPVSRFQPFGVHGPSAVVDPKSFQWSDKAWVVPHLSELIVYELHIGTFTPEGTFDSVIGKLDYLVRLGVNAVELMPIADFAGARNWGYDGVMLIRPCPGVWPA